MFTKDLAAIKHEIREVAEKVQSLVRMNEHIIDRVDTILSNTDAHTCALEQVDSKVSDIYYENEVIKHQIGIESELNSQKMDIMQARHKIEVLNAEIEALVEKLRGLGKEET